jgi:hypothetical protein
MRKTYIDNIRWLCVLTLFPYHILMIYNAWGENFYIKGADLKAMSTFLYVTWPWFMPLLFTVAGISTAYALEKRGIGGYVKERVSKLLIPLIAGILLVIPAQTYYAERFHNSYDGGYFQQYILFFTKQTDLTGYTGGFTPGQLWFVLYLFVISLVAIPVIMLYRKMKHKPDVGRLPVVIMCCLFILPTLGSLILDIGGKSLGEYFTYFFLGYFLLSNEAIQQKLENRRYILLGVSLVCTVFSALQWYEVFAPLWPVPDIFMRFHGWVSIMAILGLGRKHFNMGNKFTAYMSRSSFSVYLFHQTWIVVAAYYVFLLTDNAPAQMVLIFPVSVAATFTAYEVCKRVGVTRFLFGIKKQ